MQCQVEAREALWQMDGDQQRYRQAHWLRMSERGVLASYVDISQSAQFKTLVRNPGSKALSY